MALVIAENPMRIQSLWPGQRAGPLHNPRQLQFLGADTDNIVTVAVLGDTKAAFVRLYPVRWLSGSIQLPLDGAHRPAARQSHRAVIGLQCSDSGG
jgi:hypothetical protein